MLRDTRWLFAATFTTVALAAAGVGVTTDASVPSAGTAGLFADLLEFIVENGDEIIAIAEALLEIPA